MIITALKKVTSFGRNPGFTAYECLWFHGICIRDGKRARSVGNRWNCDKEEIQIIYNAQSAAKAIQPGLNLIVTDRLKDAVGLIPGIEWSMVSVAKVVSVPMDSEISEQARSLNIQPEDPLLKAVPEASYGTIYRTFFELIAPQENQLPEAYLTKAAGHEISFKRSDHALVSYANASAYESFPIHSNGTTLLIREDVWRTISSFINERFFDTSSIVL